MKGAPLFALAEQRRGAIIEAPHREITNGKYNKSMNRQQSGFLLSRRRWREFAPARSDCNRRSAIFRGRACICQNVILPIEFIGYIAASNADPSIIKPADSKRRAIRERENFRRIINPEAQVLFGAQGSLSSRRVYDDYFFC